MKVPFIGGGGWRGAGGGGGRDIFLYKSIQHPEMEINPQKAVSAPLVPSSSLSCHTTEY